jgi:ribosomal protein L20
MARVRTGATTKARHKKVLKAAKGYWGSKHRLYKTAKEQLMTSGDYAFRDRKARKRDFRKLWITRINAACRLNDISYSKFISGLTKADIEINRKMLSEIAINDPKQFTNIVELSKKGLLGKLVKNEVKETVEVEVAGAKATKKETKKEVKKEEKEAVDYSKMSVAELKEVAKKKKISVTGLKKAEIIAALEK